MFGMAKVLLLCMSLIALTTVAQQVEPIVLKSGLWEGIVDSDFSYRLIEINDNGQHRLFNLKITSGFRWGDIKPFTNNDIKCSASECIITIANSTNFKKQTRIIIVPYLNDSFRVIEIATNELSQPITSDSYQLDKQQNKSTVIEFIDMYHQRLDSLLAMSRNNFYGLWLGVLTLDGKKELAVLEAYPDKTSYFVRFVNGASFVNKTSFSPEDINETADDLIITTKHKLFANKLLIHRSNIELAGYMYSTSNGITHQRGVFRLYRLHNRKD